MSTHKQSLDDDVKGRSSVSSPGLDSTGHAKIEEVYNADFQQAVANTNLNPGSKTSIQLYFIVMVGFLNAVSSGFDGSLMGGINAMPQYLDFFHYKSTGASTGIVFMI
ncbi:hypothetical protein BDZ94DRAFT_870777 [Collybia nuda]|uniref:Uncharacterized protein n=1 Tax=Collybia nuda TaxID=64659 RepID=A0A9P6CBN2_9AGAR|nr:hypothetical protein BDZ94DRAFT_870777 [Collybia nuda]